MKTLLTSGISLTAINLELPINEIIDALMSIGIGLTTIWSIIQGIIQKRKKRNEFNK